jgi:hypothetical protein
VEHEAPDTDGDEGASEAFLECEPGVVSVDPVIPTDCTECHSPSSLDFGVRELCT